MHVKSRITNVRDVLSVLAVNPFSFSRVTYYSFREFFVEIFENLYDLFNKKKNEFVNFSLFYPFFPFFRLGINAVLREVETESAILDMKRKVPRICINYNGYDWVSHYRGPNRKSSYMILREIDKKLKWLYKVAKEEGYDFYVFSDHGNVPGIPFDRLYNQSLSEFITRVKEKKRHVRDTRGDYVAYKLSYLHENFSIPLKSVNTFLMKLLKVHRKDDSVGEISVHNSSCISHVYFNKFDHQLSLDEIEKHHPGLIEKIVSHEGVGLVIGKEKDKFKILSKHDNVLSKYGDEKLLLKMIDNFFKLKNFGDLFIMGDIIDGKIVTFEDFHLGSHDGFGLGQERGFFISKENYDFSDSLDSRVLHKVFENYLDSQ